MEEFEPKIIGFFCNWCSYTGADLAGTSFIAPLFRNKWIGALIGCLIAFAFAATGAYTGLAHA